VSEQELTSAVNAFDTLISMCFPCWLSGAHLTHAPVLLLLYSNMLLPILVNCSLVTGTPKRYQLNNTTSKCALCSATLCLSTCPARRAEGVAMPSKPLSSSCYTAHVDTLYTEVQSVGSWDID
jgi:hypothetical protein